MPDFEHLEFEVTSTEVKAVRSYFTRMTIAQARIMLWAWLGITLVYAIGAGLRLSEHRDPFSVFLAFVYVGGGVVGVCLQLFGSQGPRIVPSPGLDARVTVNATGLNLRFKGGVVDLPWRRIERVVALEDAFVFISNMAWRWKPAIVLPRRVLAPGEAERLWTFIDDHMTAKRGIVRGVEFARPTIFNTLAQKR